MKKVLIADDERVLRMLVVATLEEEGIQILEAHDGSETLLVARSERPDVILLDVQMPGLNGFAVCEELKADPRTAAIPVVMLTAQSQPEARERGEQAGAAAYLTKPFSPLELLSLINTYLGR